MPSFKRLTALLATTAAAAAVVAVPVTTAQAKHGADDAPGHVRHSGTDDSASTAKERVRHHTPSSTHHRHGADDGPNHS